jgi:hypothetical protein
MAIPFQPYDRIDDRVEELRHEVAQIVAAVKEWHLSGPQKVRHERRIQKLVGIRSESSGLIWKDGWGVKF